MVEMEVERIGETYLDGLLRGETPSHRQILDAHPHLAGPIERRLKLIDMMREGRLLLPGRP